MLIASELKLAFRQLNKSPAFTVTAVLMLAFSVGATTAIFSIVDAVLLRPLPYPHADRLMTVGDQVEGTSWGYHDSGPATGPEAAIYPRDMRAFENLGAYGYVAYELAGIGDPAQVVGARMTPKMFAALEVAPTLGRVFTDQEDQQHEQVAVLSYVTWKSRFNGDPRIVGRKILLDRKPYVVVGVMPKGFEFPLYPGRENRCELWVPMSLMPQEVAPEANANWFLYLVGRLKPGVTAVQAQEDADRVVQEVMRGLPPDEAKLRMRPVAHPLQKITVMDARPMLRMLFSAVAVVLLIACTNLAGLLLVRAIRRRREMAVRLAIGAPPLTLLRQAILESVVLNLIGGVLGIGVAMAALALGKDLLPDTLPLVNLIQLNWTVVIFALVLALGTGVCCGLAPGFAALRTNVNAAMKEGGRSGSAGGNHGRLRSVLVITEIAVALVLLTAAGLLLRSFKKMSAVDLGFTPEHVTTAGYALPAQEYPTQGQIDGFNKRLLQQLRQLPGVEAAGLTSTIPATGAGIEAFVVDEADPKGPSLGSTPPTQVIGDFFRVMGIPLQRGRYFTDADDAEGQLVVIVNHEFAEHYWPHKDPIGRHMRVGGMKSITPWMTVVGEVADAKLNAPDADAQEQFYQPVAQLTRDGGNDVLPSTLWGNNLFIVVRSALPAQHLEEAIRATVRRIDPRLPLNQIQTMDDVVEQSEAPRRFNTIVISSFALAAVLLAVLGIYSIIAFSVASRVQEMAIRMALGSQRSDIVRLVVVAGLKLAAAGCLIGLAIGLVVSNILRSFLFDVSPFDPVTMALTSAVVFVLAIVASALPARRAASVDPIRALRGD
ncbi:MAG TPA: ABC transporter permease [Acidobacteriaceae bacterium]|jgi:predicted permease|nr:ABC transporter permease [Acidobacteriaceae bacterium]